MSDHNHSHSHPSPGGSGPYALIVELREHVPFSVSAVSIGLIVAGALCILGSGLGLDSYTSPGAVDQHGADVGEREEDAHDHAHAVGERADDEYEHTDHDHGPPFARLFFHLFHPAHMFFSAAATAAMFCRYERKYVKAVIVGLIGAIGICGVSDIVMPHVSLLLLGVSPPWHICVVEHPWMVLPFAFVGVIVGIGAAGSVERSTIISHSLHVLASTMASIFYMVGPLGLVAWIDRIGIVFLFVVLAVMIPCCLSDIVFPLLMSKAGRDRYGEAPHTH